MSFLYAGTGLVALITCLRQARVSGLLTAKDDKKKQQAPVDVMEKHKRDPSDRMWCGIVEQRIIRAALSSCDEQVSNYICECLYCLVYK